jgi:hypothetical protein
MECLEHDATLASRQLIQSAPVERTESNPAAASSGLHAPGEMDQPDPILANRASASEAAALAALTTQTQVIPFEQLAVTSAPTQRYARCAPRPVRWKRIILAVAFCGLSVYAFM